MLASVNQQFTQLTTREKVLVMISGAVLIVFAGFTFLVEPKYLENKSSKLAEANTRLELSGVEQKLMLLKSALDDDPNIALQIRIDNLNQRSDALDQEFATQMRELVPAQQMPMVIETMLAESDKLKLLELTSIATKSLFSDDSEYAELPLYQNGVRFVFEGRYVEILSYLEAVESFPWQLYWRSFDYQVTEYPNATITLELYTLSTTPTFMGVQ